MIRLILFTLILLIPSSVIAQYVPQLVITEIMYNPSVMNTISDDKGEWFEIYNKGTSEVSLQGISINDHVIADDIKISPGSYVVLCRNSNSEENGGVTCAYQYAGVKLNNDDGEIILRRDGSEIDKVVYDDADWDGVSGASVELNDWTSDNLVSTNWHVAYNSFGKGDKGTPGKENSPVPTPTPTITPTPTNTPKPTPTDTPTPTPKPTDEPTSTPKQPTATKIPTATPMRKKISPTPTHAKIVVSEKPTSALVDQEDTMVKHVLGDIDRPLAEDISAPVVNDGEVFASGQTDTDSESPNPVPFVILGCVAMGAMIVSAIMVYRKNRMAPMD